MATGMTTPLICGVNDGSHIYVDAGAGTSSEAVLTAALTGTSSRKWKIKVINDKDLSRKYNFLPGLTNPVRFPHPPPWWLLTVSHWT